MRNHMFSFFMLYFQMQLHAFLVLKIVVFFFYLNGSALQKYILKLMTVTDGTCNNG